MDDILKRTDGMIEEMHANLTRLEQELIDRLDRVRAIRDSIEGNGLRPSPASATHYDVIDDIVPLIKEAPEPMSQVVIFERLKRIVMEKMRKDEKNAQADIYRSLWYHSKRGPATGDDRGIRAVERQADGTYKVTSFKTKGARRQYPNNLIWHASKL